MRLVAPLLIMTTALAEDEKLDWLRTRRRKGVRRAKGERMRGVSMTKGLNPPSKHGWPVDHPTMPQSEIKKKVWKEDKPVRNKHEVSGKERGDLPYYVHIPKTGGTWIESISTRLNEKKYWGVARGWNKVPPRWNHTVPGFKACPFRKWYNNCCSEWHIPLKYFSDFDETVETFTVIREPIERMVSEMKFEKRSEKRCESYNSDIQKRIQSYRDGNKLIADCHFIPQIEYVTNAKGELLENMKIYCQHNLTASLTKLYPEVAEVGKKHEMVGSCTLTTADLTAETTQLIQEFYAEDFKLYNRFCT